MALELYQTSKYSRLYREVLPNGARRGYLSTTLGPMNYESVLDSGEFDVPIDMQVERVTTDTLDGYQIVQSGWHFSIQTEPPVNNQRPVGTVGFGGRKGAHWFYFRLTSLGYLNWTSRAVRDILGPPDYSSPLQVNEVTRNLVNHPNLPDEIHTSSSEIIWPNIWTPGGGEISLRWVLTGGKLKEELIINQVAREWIEANEPSTTPDNRTYFGPHFEVDGVDIPQFSANGVARGRDDDFDDGEGNIELLDADSNLLAFMPLDVVYVANQGGRRNLRKRFYRQGNENHLFVGVRVDEMAGLLPGDLILDPSMTQEAIAATADDGYEGGGTMDTTPPYGNTIFVGSGSYHGAWRFTPNLPQGASLTGGGSEYATLSLYGTVSGLYRFAGTPTFTLSGDDQDNAPAWQDGTGTERPTGTGFTPTTATYAVSGLTDPGSNGVFGGGFDVAAIVEEIVGRAGWSANNGMRFRALATSGSGNYIGVADFDSGNTEARLDAYYTTGGGGPTETNLLSLLGVG